MTNINLIIDKRIAELEAKKEIGNQFYTRWLELLHLKTLINKEGSKKNENNLYK